MKKVISTENIPIKMWLDKIEPVAELQARNLSNLPFAFHHIALMPDCHEGFGMPIGGILAAKETIVPNAVGVDIGCGMSAARTSISSIDRERLKKIMGLIRESIPVGFRHQKEMQDKFRIPALKSDHPMKIIRQEYQSALYQLGTLGGGNHFIEIQKGSDGFVWIMVHSGSRNLGKQVADYYNRVAQQLNRSWNSPFEKAKDLAYLPMHIPQAAEYFAEMTYCQNFAVANRKLMMEKIMKSFVKVLGKQVLFDNAIDIAHNYARREVHFGNEVIVHRKGATSARPDETGIIPGSQGTASYIVAGLGNPESFMSCSHGAGRKMSRHRAQKSLNLKEVIETMDRQGIIHGIRSPHDLDEAPDAYKDIDEVMENQNDLVRIIVELKPLAVIKG